MYNSRSARVKKQKVKEAVACSAVLWGCVVSNAAWPKFGPHWPGPHLLGLARLWRGAITVLVPRIRHRGL